MVKSNYEVVLLDESTIEQQIELYKQAFDISEDVNFLRPFWLKKHYQNPLGPSLIFGIFVEDVLAGMNAYLPGRYCYQNKDILCLQSCESGVSPKFQGKGIWETIVRYAVEYIHNKTEYQFIYGFPNYRNSYPGFVKMGWKTISMMNNYIMVNNTHSFGRLISTKKILQLLVKPLIIQKLPLNLCSMFGRLSVSPCAVENVSWPSDRDYISAEFNKESLKWKAEYKKMHSICVKHSNSIVSYAMYGLEPFDGEVVIRIDKIVFLDSLISKVLIVAKIIDYVMSVNNEAAIIRIWTNNDKNMNGILKKLLFITSRHPNPFIIKEESTKYANLKWKLSFYDLD